MLKLLELKLYNKFDDNLLGTLIIIFTNY